MAICPSCESTSVPDGARFCPSCGATIEVPPTEPPIVEPLKTKKASFSETTWFKEGAEADPEALIVDSDVELSREELEERYVPRELDKAVREKFTLNRDGDKDGDKG